MIYILHQFVGPKDEDPSGKEFRFFFFLQNMIYRIYNTSFIRLRKKSLNLTIIKLSRYAGFIQYCPFIQLKS